MNARRFPAAGDLHSALLSPLQKRDSFPCSFCASPRWPNLLSITSDQKDRHLKTLAFYTFVALLPVAAAAQEASDVSPLKTSSEHAGFSIDAGVSTLGATVEPGYRFNDSFGVRLPMGQGSFSFTEEFDGNDVAADLDIGGVGLMADLYPFGGGFRVSGGAFKTNYEASFTANDVDFGGYSSDLSGRIAPTKDFAPAMTVGYDGRIGRHLVMSADIGAMFSGGFDVTASESSGMASQAEIDAEIQELRDTAGDIKAIPFLRLSVGLAF